MVVAQNRMFDLVKYIWNHSDDYDGCMKFIEENGYTTDDVAEAIIIMNAAKDQFEQELRDEKLEEMCLQCGSHHSDTVSNTQIK